MNSLETMRQHFQDPYASYAAARQARLFKDARGVWYAATYDDVDAILRDRRFGKKALPGTEHRLPFEQRQEQHDRLAVLNIDPPDHTRIRGLLTRAFSAGRMEAIRSSPIGIRATAPSSTASAEGGISIARPPTATIGPIATLEW